MSNILVTGGAGFIGSHACKALFKAGHHPVVVDNLSRGHRDAVKWGTFHQVDVGDKEALGSVLKENKIEAVIHFAAYAYVGESTTDPSLYFVNNCSKMVSLLDSCREAGISRFIFSSSCATYGTPTALPLTEESPQAPISPYGFSKLFGEKLLQSYADAYGINFTALRYFNAAGSDTDGELGERHDPETHLIPNVILAAQGKKPMLEIYGEDYDTPDGTAVRDYVHVEDLADGHVAAAHYLLDGGTSTYLNFGSGHGYSVLDVVKEVEKQSGRPVPRVMKPRRAGDPPGLYASPGLAEKTLGWRAERSNMETIVSSAYSWFSKH